MKVLQVVCLILLLSFILAQIQLQENDSQVTITITEKPIQISIDKNPQLPNGIKIGVGPNQRDFEMYLSIIYQLDQSQRPIIETAELLSEYDWIFPSPTIINNFVQLIMVGHPKEEDHDLIIQITIDKDRITTLLALAGYQFNNNASFLGIRAFVNESGLIRESIFSEPEFKYLQFNKTAMIDRRTVPVLINFDNFAIGTPSDLIFEKFDGDLKYAIFVDLEPSQEAQASQTPSPPQLSPQIPSPPQFPSPTETPTQTSPLIPSPTTPQTEPESTSETLPPITQERPTIVPPELETPSQPTIVETPTESRIPSVLESLAAARSSETEPTEEQVETAQSPRSILQSLINPRQTLADEQEEITPQPIVQPVDGTPVSEPMTPSDELDELDEPDETVTPPDELDEPIQE